MERRPACERQASVTGGFALALQLRSCELVDHLIDGHHLGEGRAEHGAGCPLEHVPRHAVRVDREGAVAEKEDPEVAHAGVAMIALLLRIGNMPTAIRPYSNIPFGVSPFKKGSMKA